MNDSERLLKLETQQSHTEKTFDAILLTLKEMNDKFDKMNEKVDNIRTEMGKIKPDIMTGIYRFSTLSAVIGALVVSISNSQVFKIPQSPSQAQASTSPTLTSDTPQSALQ